MHIRTYVPELTPTRHSMRTAKTAFHSWRRFLQHSSTDNGRPELAAIIGRSFNDNNLHNYMSIVIRRCLDNRCQNGRNVFAAKGHNEGFLRPQMLILVPNERHILYAENLKKCSIASRNILAVRLNHIRSECVCVFLTCSAHQMHSAPHSRWCLIRITTTQPIETSISQIYDQTQ